MFLYTAEGLHMCYWWGCSGVAHRLCWCLIHVQETAAITWWWKSSLQKTAPIVLMGTGLLKALAIDVVSECPTAMLKNLSLSLSLCLQPLSHCVHPPSTTLYDRSVNIDVISLHHDDSSTCRKLLISSACACMCARVLGFLCAQTHNCVDCQDGSH